MAAGCGRYQALTLAGDDLPMMLRILAIALVFAAGAARADGLQVVVSDADCRWLTAHLPADDVAYQPGRDVHGGTVAPADLPGSAQVALPDTIPIYLTIPVETFLGPDASPFVAPGDVDAGVVTIDRRTGEVAYNDVPVSTPGRAWLVAACDERAKSRHR